MNKWFSLILLLLVCSCNIKRGNGNEAVENKSIVGEASENKIILGENQSIVDIGPAAQKQVAYYRRFFTEDDYRLDFIAVKDKDSNEFIAYNDDAANDYDGNVVCALAFQYLVSKKISYEELKNKRNLSDEERKAIYDEVYYDNIDKILNLSFNSRGYGWIKYKTSVPAYGGLHIFRLSKESLNSDYEYYPADLPPDGALCYTAY